MFGPGGNGRPWRFILLFRTCGTGIRRCTTRTTATYSATVIFVSPRRYKMNETKVNTFENVNHLLSECCEWELPEAWDIACARTLLMPMPMFRGLLARSIGATELFTIKNLKIYNNGKIIKNKKLTDIANHLRCSHIFCLLAAVVVPVQYVEHSLRIFLLLLFADVAGHQQSCPRFRHSLWPKTLFNTQPFIPYQSFHKLTNVLIRIKLNCINNRWKK